MEAINVPHFGTDTGAQPVRLLIVYMGAEGVPNAIPAVASPYRMRFAILVRRGEETFDAVDNVPEQLRKRTLAVRAFDRDGMMVGFELVEGVKLESAIERHFADPRAAYLHLHFAAPGCYAASVERA